MTRVAFLTDCYHEVNGVGLTSRQFEAYAKRRELPFLCARCGPETQTWQDGSVQAVELERGPFAIQLDRDFTFDLRLYRHLGILRSELLRFQPDVIHVTSPGDLGILGAWLAHELKIPLAASWHTNIHEFAGRRLLKMLHWLPSAMLRPLSAHAEAQVLNAATRFYKIARVLLAPNSELVEMLRARTGKPVFLMPRGSDTALFSPAKRTRKCGPFTIGYVGRLTPEKNVRMLAQIEAALTAAGAQDFEFVIVGEGSERPWLSANMKHAVFTGVLKGEPLARAYANMDVFVFPSETDTYGNVVNEAFASGVPAVVSSAGGPKFLVIPGITGFVAQDAQAFTGAVARVMHDPELHLSMSSAARLQAEKQSWDRVFEQVYEAYRIAMAVGTAESSPGSLPSASCYSMLKEAERH